MSALVFPPTPSDGDTYAGYVFNAAKNVWQWQALVPSVESLSDTVITAPSDGDTLVYDNGDWVNFPSGKILQVVRTEITSGVDVTGTVSDVAGLTVTITPSSTDSKIILWCSATVQMFATFDAIDASVLITDSSNVVVSGAQDHRIGLQNYTGASTRLIWESLNVWGFSEPNTTSPVTYKVRVGTNGSTIRWNHGAGRAQLFAMEVAG